VGEVLSATLYPVSRCCSFAASTRALLSDRERSPVFSYSRSALNDAR
jgi:hypothetical protein